MKTIKKLSSILGQIGDPRRNLSKLHDLNDILLIGITIDAMGCQTDIAKKIIDQEADYILAVKDNQRQLHQNIKDEFRFSKTIKSTNQKIWITVE